MVCVFSSKYRGMVSDCDISWSYFCYRCLHNTSSHIVRIGREMWMDVNATISLSYTLKSRKFEAVGARADVSNYQ